MTGLGMAAQETIKPLLRPNQVAEKEAELKRLSEMLAAPPHISNAVNRDDIRRLASGLKKDLREQTPLPYEGRELDAAVKRERELRETMVDDGMPAADEMRRNPPGTVGQHMRWEHKNKARLLEWKNHRLRLHASGALDEPAGSPDIANFERYRPHVGRRDLSVAQIVRPTIDIPMAATKAENIRNVMSDDDRKSEEDQLLALAERLALAGNDVGKRTLMAILRKQPEAAPAAPKGPGEYDVLYKRAKELGFKPVFGKKQTKDELKRIIADLERAPQAAE